ncbi:unnamed protein product, partial [Pylaiella littoralis]
ILQEGNDPPGLLDLVYANDANRGKCNVIFVGIVPDGILPDDPTVPAVAEENRTQKKQLQDYSRKFNVRIVYFDVANTIRDPEVKTRLGMEDRYNPGWQVDGANGTKLTGT